MTQPGAHARRSHALLLATTLTGTSSNEERRHCLLPGTTTPVPINPSSTHIPGRYNPHSRVFHTQTLYAVSSPPTTGVQGSKQSIRIHFSIHYRFFHPWTSVPSSHPWMPLLSPCLLLEKLASFQAPCWDQLGPDLQPSASRGTIGSYTTRYLLEGHGQLRHP